MRILVFCSTYVPASRGGTAQAISGLVAHLGRRFELMVFAGDGLATPGSAATGRWLAHGNALVYRATAGDSSPQRIARIVREAGADGYYVNSFLSPRSATLPVILRWLGVLPRRPMLLAPRGELNPAALRFKRSKKLAFIELARHLPAYSDLVWHAGTHGESTDIRRVFPHARVEVARDLCAPRPAPARRSPAKKPGELSLVYLSRITPMKNLVGAFRMLRRIRGEVSFTVYGPAEADYFAQCQRARRSLPANVRVTFEDEIPHEEVLETLAGHHVFFLPTFGESFGHAIVEALLAGCVVVTSDETPWRNLRQAGVGWDLPVHDEMAYGAVLQDCVDMDEQTYGTMSLASRRLGRAIVDDPAAVEANRAMLTALVQGR